MALKSKDQKKYKGLENPAILNAKQIERFDTIGYEKHAAKMMLDTALNYYANRLEEITRDERQAWEEVGLQFGFDPSEQPYSIRKVDGKVQVAVEDKD